MSYVALYRKFRPQTFDQVKGQDHVVRALKNQLINGRIGHSYLFTGTRGTGKTSAARIFARAINCLHPVNGEPCNECENCKAINAGNFVDVVEVDAASNNGVDDIRRIIEEVRYTPVKGKYKVFIIDEAHMITGPAFNAFLKTLEEPPAYAVFILATTEPHKLPITILSRCQRYDFHRITRERIAENLSYIMRQEGIEAEEKALDYIARVGDGSMRDSISLLDKCIAFSLGERLTYDSVLDTLGTVDTEVFSGLFRSVYTGNVPAALNLIDDAVSRGRDLTQFTTDLIWYIRNILMVQAADMQDPDILGISAENLKELSEDAKMAQAPVLMRYIRILSELLNQLRFSSDKQVLLEVAVIRLARPEMETDTESLADRIRQLEARLQAGIIQTPAPAYEARQMMSPVTPTTPSAHGQNTDAMSSQGGYHYQGPDPGAEEDEFFGGLGIGARMTNPDAFSDLLGDPEPQAYTGASTEGIRQQENMAEPVMNPVAQSQDIPGQESGKVRQPGSAAPAEGDLAALWPGIISACANPRIRVTLHKCRIIQGSQGQARILAPSEFAMKQLKDEAVLTELRGLIRQAAGKEMEVQVAMAGSEPAGPQSRDPFPEELLSQINFNIGTEEW